MRMPKHTGRSSDPRWITRDELNHMKWFEEVRCSRIKQKARGEKLKPINLD